MGFATLNLLLAKGAISRIADSMAMAGRFDEVPLRSDRKRVLFMGIRSPRRSALPTKRVSSGASPRLFRSSTC